MRRLRRLLDERDAAGGRLKGLIFLAHPGPSLLVTASTVGIARLATRGEVRPLRLLRLGVAMLTTQVAIGVTNDWADIERDRVAKPHKPLVRGTVRRPTAALVAGGAGLSSLGIAAGLGGAPLAGICLGLGAGLAYDLGLKSNAASLLTWWGGLIAVPLVACTAVGRPLHTLRRLPLLAGLVAAGLHCANALPDLADDARDGVRSLPVQLGPGRAAAVALAAPAAAVLVAAGQRADQPARRFLGVAAAGMLAADLLAALALRRRGARSRVPFQVLAPASAALGLTWLAAALREQRGD